MFTPSTTHGLAIPTDDFWKSWRTQKSEMKMRGIHVAKINGQYFIIYPLLKDLSTT